MADGSHASETGVAGSTVRAAATDVGSIAALKSIVTGSVRPRFVENVVVNAAWVSGRTGDGGRATVEAGRPTPMRPTSRASDRATTMPMRTTGERRMTAPRWTATTRGTASSVTAA